MISHTFYTDNLNIGGSLESLLYCYVTSSPLIIEKPRRPLEIDKIHSDLDFTFLGFREGESIYSCHLWERLSFLLSMGGLLLFPNCIETVREANNKLTVVTHTMQKVEVSFNKLRRFDTKLTNHTWIYDWFAVRSGGKHDVEVLESDDWLAKKIIFYPSKRAGVRDAKDVVACSFTKTNEIFDMEYSEGYAALKTRKMMKEAGITGTSKGIGYGGKRRYDPIRIEHMYREHKEQLIPDMTIKQILDLPRNEEGELCKMTRNLFRQRLHSIWPG